MNRLVLPLEGGITGVVGPNGCGKSNIVDAIRWVLGETKASSLRGGSLEDVIFNGTDTLRPLGLAEVTLTLRANSENFFEDLVSPQLEVDQVLKSLEEEVKHKQHELLGDKADDENASGLQLRVIEGKLSQVESSAEPDSEDDLKATIISLEGETVAEFVDEADTDSSGPDVATSLLTRFSWLKSVSEVQITRRLYRSGESEFFINRVACRLKDIRDFLRAIGLGARAYTIVAQGEVSRIVTSKPEERRVIIEEAAGVIGFKDKIAASNRKLDETAQNLARLNDVIGEVERQVSSLKRQAERAQNRQSLKDEIERLETLVWKDKVYGFDGRNKEALNKQAELTAQLSEAQNKLTAVEANEANIKSELSVYDVQADDLRLQIDTRREELLSRARKRSEKQTKLNEVRAFNLARQTEIRRLEERKQVLEQRLLEADSGTSSIKAREVELQNELNSVQLVSEEELKSVATNLKQKRDELRIKEGEVRVVRENIVSHQSSIKAMQDQIIAASPLNQLKKTLSGDVLQGLTEAVSVFVEGLVVPSTYAKAIQSVLSEQAAFLVADDPEAIGQAFLERITSSAKRGDNQTAGIGILKKGNKNLPAKIDSVAFVRAIDVIQIKPGFEAAAVSLLGNVYIAQNSSEAFAFFKSGAVSPEVLSTLTIVTLDGEVHTDVSFFSLRHDGGLIQVQAKVLELQSELANLEVTQAQLIAQRDQIQQEVHELETKQSELLRESEVRQRVFRELTANLASIRGRLQVEIRQVDQLKADIEKTVQSVKEVEQKIQDGLKEEQILADLAGHQDKEGETIIESEIKDFSVQLKDIEDKRKGFRDQLSAFSTSHRSLQTQIDSIKAGLSQAELSLQKIELERQHIEERVITEYGQEKLDSIRSFTEDYQPIGDQTCSEYEKESQKIRARIAREGEVDSSSIERYQEERIRLEDLEGQRDDLAEACSVLKKTIARLEEVSKVRFVSMFNSVSQNFSRLIPQLFGGGKGSLQLSDPSKPLETGVEIVMRPPGKKPKSIDLLSGGEKALCATALIFSIFLEKPSPICVLDEVDAPLDEANLIRFLTLVQQMSGRTQFLLVTHNKRSMATADHLIGVTMQQPGTSTVISVSLQEAIATGAQTTDSSKNPQTAVGY